MEIQKIFSEINTDEKIYSVLLNEEELALFSEIQKEFNNKAQKARRAKWETENQSRPSQKDIDYQLKDPRSKMEKELDQKLGIKDNPRYNKTQKEAIDAAKKKNFRSDLRWKNTAADELALGPAIRQEFRKDKAQLLKKRKQTSESIKKFEKEMLENEAKEKAERKAAEFRASIAKHEAKAAELRAKKVAGQKLIKNLKTAGKVGLGVAGAAGIGYGIKKAVDKKKKDNQ